MRIIKQVRSLYATTNHLEIGCPLCQKQINVAIDKPVKK